MDLFRYFHPHHNPRLRKVPLRLQELGELELAARELERALQRAQIRYHSSAIHLVGGEEEIELDEALISISAVVKALSALVAAHPGDTAKTMEKMIEERKNIPGWESWSRIVKERLEQSLLERKAAGL
jgi:hypothetical protein